MSDDRKAALDNALKKIEKNLIENQSEYFSFSKDEIMTINKFVVILQVLELPEYEFLHLACNHWRDCYNALYKRL
mgnify:CR=1 FL=1